MAIAYVVRKKRIETCWSVVRAYKLGIQHAEAGARRMRLNHPNDKFKAVESLDGLALEVQSVRAQARIGEVLAAIPDAKKGSQEVS